MALMSTRTDVSAADGVGKSVELSVALVSGLALVIVALFMCVAPLVGKVAGARDFVFYWATGQQLIHHANPYDVVAMGPIERGAGLPAKYSVGFMRNPPYALPLALPLGLVGLRVGTLLWSLLLLASLAASVHMLWQMFGRPRNSLHWLAYSFGPAIICLLAGQTAMFALLGLVLFLRLHRTRPFLAGVSLWLCALKPHLFLPFAVVLLAWIIVSRSYRVLLGATFSVAASSVLAFLLAPIKWGDYLRVLHSPGSQWEFVPCVSVLLRVWISKDTAWLNYVPAALGCAWGLGYFWAPRRTWDWATDGSLVMLVSILVAPYAWLYDQALAIPALLEGAYVARSQSVLAALALLSALIELALLAIVWKPEALYNWTLWSAPAWIVWYVYATAARSRRAVGGSAEAIVKSR